LTWWPEVRYNFAIVLCSQERLSRCTIIAWLVMGCVMWPCAPITQHARAGEVRGQLILGSLREAAAQKPPRAAYNWELENGVKEVLPVKVSAARELAVVLLGAGEAKTADQVEVAVSGGALMPQTIVLRSGTTLRLRNDDEIGHELFAEGLDGFSAEATSPGATRSMHLTKAGSWPLHDRLVAHANAQLLVFANLIANAHIEPNGSFAFSEIAPGKYTLKVFRGAAELVSKEIEVADKTLSVEPLTLMAAKGSP
jgi:hypothetical protein